jgi:hypothetical protein
MSSLEPGRFGSPAGGLPRDGLPRDGLPRGSLPDEALVERGTWQYAHYYDPLTA